jgi:hypothetical protein
MKTFAICFIIQLFIHSSLSAQDSLQLMATTQEGILSTNHICKFESLDQLLDKSLEELLDYCVEEDISEVKVAHKHLDDLAIYSMDSAELFTYLHSLDGGVEYKSADILTIVAITDMVVIDGQKIPTDEVIKRLSYLYNAHRISLIDVVYYYNPSQPYDPRTIISITTKP